MYFIKNKNKIIFLNNIKDKKENIVHSITAVYNDFKKNWSSLDLNYQYGWNRIMMKYAGIWPEERKWNRRSSYIVLLPFLSMLCFVCGPQTINLPRIAPDMDLVAENLSMGNMTITISLTKTIIFWMNGGCKSFMF